MAPHSERSDRIRDLARDLSKLDYTSNDLRKYLGPEMGALNVKQTEGIVTLIEAVRGIILALAALNKQMSDLTGEDGQVLLTTGDAFIRMRKDGTMEIKANDLHVRGAGDIEIKAAKDLYLKGNKVL